MKLALGTMALCASLVFAPLALAQGDVVAPAEKADKKAEKEDMGDANRMICRTMEATGSRLNSKRVCASASEWAAMKQQNRMGLDQAQTANSKNF